MSIFETGIIKKKIKKFNVFCETRSIMSVQGEFLPYVDFVGGSFKFSIAGQLTPELIALAEKLINEKFSGTKNIISFFGEFKEEEE